LVFPPTITAGFAGSAQVFQQSLRGQGWLLLATVVVIYIVLGILYESFLHPSRFFRACRPPASVRS
jgi:HAE1 family hydrophobic/amphiphilic exporter-1